MGYCVKRNTKESAAVIHYTKHKETSHNDVNGQDVNGQEFSLFPFFYVCMSVCFVCVSTHVHARARACVCVCACVCVYISLCMFATVQSTYVELA